MKAKNTYARTQIESEIITISPQTATAMLATMPPKSNRHLRASHAEMLADLIRRDEWQVTHCGIAFSPAGHLIDGQHRLQAVVLAERPVQMMVTYGLPTEAMTGVDRVANRSIGDLLHFVHEVEGGSSLTSMCRVIQREFLGNGLPQSVAGTLAIYRAYKPGLDWAVGQVPNKTVMNSAQYRAAFALAYLHDAKTVGQFYETYHTGKSADPDNDPAWWLREFTIRITRGAKIVREPPAMLFRIGCNAVVAAIKRQPTKSISRVEDGLLFLKTALKGGAA